MDEKRYYINNRCVIKIGMNLIKALEMKL